MITGNSPSMPFIAKSPPSFAWPPGVRGRHRGDGLTYSPANHGNTRLMPSVLHEEWPQIIAAKACTCCHADCGGCEKTKLCTPFPLAATCHEAASARKMPCEKYELAVEMLEETRP
jgi:hypothetical protein